MYKMKADGVVFYDPSSDDMALHVLSPKAKYELNKAGSLEFTMLPGNVLYDGLHKLKTIITLEQDGEVIFRGRVLETETDLYNQKKVYCEGELAYLLDSIQRPYEYKGSAKEYFPMLIEKHNADVEEHKRFTVGLLTALRDEDTVEIESENYANSLEEFKSILLSEFNGYLRIRYENGVRYLDYVDKFNQSCSQEINFGVNLVDIETNINAQDVCSVLIPVGRSRKGKYTDISKANGGKDYIEDATLIAKYGRVVKSYTFDEVEDPEELLELGRKHMEKMAAETTLTIKAVDLRTVGADVDGIRLGDTVKLVSAPHGLNKEDVCTKIELDIEKPEKSEYTFGMPRETLTDNNASASRKNRRESDHFHKWLKETNNSFDVYVEAADAQINLNATHINEMGERVSSAEVRISGAESAITAKADNVRVEAIETEITGLVKAEDLEANYATFDYLEANYVSARGDVDLGNVVADTINAGTLSTDELGADVVRAGELTVGGTAFNPANYVTNSRLTNYATQSWVIDKSYVTASELSTTLGSYVMRNKFEALEARVAALEAK